MTRDEILVMPAGRQIEALIAEKVFGWKWLPWPGNTEQKVLVQFPEQAESIDWWGKDVMDLVPIYSTDIAAAWEVVERMSVFIRLHRYSDTGKWEVRFASEKDRVIYFPTATAVTAPLAICRAALLVVLWESDS